MQIVDDVPEKLARQAADIAASGYPVFPCSLDKSPCTQHGHKDATDNPKFAYDLFMRHKNARLIGCPMGTDTAMVLAIDVDPLGMVWFRNNWHRLGDTRIHKTPRGGSHILYQQPSPPAPIIGCRQIVGGEKLLADGVDVKGRDGYIIFAGPGYEVLNDIPPAPLPIWLKNRLTRQPKQPKEKRKVQITPAAQALEGALAAVEHSKLGERNNLLYWAACRAGELVKEGTLGESKAIDLCTSSGHRAGLSELEALRTTKSGIAMGKRGG